MKKVLSVLLTIMMLTGAAFAEAQPETEMPETEIQPQTDVLMDLDGDGTEETVRWEVVEQEDYMEGAKLTVTSSDGAKTAEWSELSLFAARVAAKDLDGDGAVELFVTGDQMSDDYVTFCMHYADGELKLMDFACVDRGGAESEYANYGYGSLSLLPDNLVALSGSQDVLGTYFGTRVFALNPTSQAFDLADEGFWEFDADVEDSEMWEYRSLKLTAPISVMLADENGEHEDELQPGDQIMITASDLESVAYFVTRDGREGYMNVERNTDAGWGSLVNGIPENELFEMIPYAD